MRRLEAGLNIHPISSDIILRSLFAQKIRLKFIYSFSQELSKCKEITLLDETINGEIATLNYAQTDVCGNNSAKDER